MTDGVIKGAGNSRYLKSVPNFLTLYPTYEDFAAALIAGTLPFDLNGINQQGWSQQGMPLNKGNLLTDAVANALALTGDKTPAQAFEKLRQLVSTAQSTADGAVNRTINRLIYETGVYKGTGTKMSKTITCTERPRVLFIYGTQPSVKEIALSAYNFSLVTYSATNDGVFFPRSNIACSWDSKSLTLSDVSNNNLNNQIASYYYVVLEG